MKYLKRDHIKNIWFSADKDKHKQKNKTSFTNNLWEQWQLFWYSQPGKLNHSEWQLQLTMNCDIRKHSRFSQCFLKREIEFVAKYILTTGSLQPRTSVDFASRESHSISVVGRVVARCYNIQHHLAFNNAMYCLKINMKIIFSLIIPCPFSSHNDFS